MPASPDFSVLDAHAARLRGSALSTMSQHDPARASEFALREGPLYFNFARQSYDRPALDALFGLAQGCDVQAAYRRMFDGEKVNVTEDRAALHTALRGNHSDAVVAREAFSTASEVRKQMGQLVAGLEASGITDIVSVGIGGSDLGPRLVADALREPAGGRFRVHFLSNVDGAAAQRVLAPLDPSRTAAILISKTFSTQETLLNGRILHDWLGGSERLYAVSANPELSLIHI